MTAASTRAVALAGVHDTSSGSRPDMSREVLTDTSREVLTDTSHQSRVDTSARSPHDASPSGPRDASTARLCAWCHRPIPAGARRDAVTCSKRCRQARHRFTRAVGRGVAADVPLRLAYADPPYPGLAERYYRDHPDYGGEVDHAELIRRLSTYDGWALSTSAAALPAVLALCPPAVRVAAWVRGERPVRSGRPLNAWEPVIYHGGRHIDPSPGSARHLDPSSLEERQQDAPSRHTGTTRRLDALVHHARPRRTDPARVIGAKPAAFARWMFDLLGAQPGDELHDLFPGSGGITRAWHAYTTNPTIREDQPA
jgi:hypothetical protein